MQFLLAAHDFPYIFPKLAQSLLTWPWLWQAKDHDGFGVFSLATLWGWPQEVVYGLLTRLGVDWSVVVLLWGVVFVALAGWIGMGKLLGKYGLSRSAILVGRLLFTVNTYLLLLVDGGQLSLALAYALLPLVIYTLPRTLEFVSVVLLISILDIRVVFMVVVLVGLHLVFNLKKVRHCLLTGIITTVVLGGWHAYWIVPSVLVRLPALPVTYSRPSQVSFLSFANIAHSLALYQPHWPKNIFGQTTSTPGYFLLLPVIALLPIVIYRGHRTVGYWTTLVLVAIFLSKGSNPPWPNLYTWLFESIPGFSLFRDPSKFYFLSALAYSILWGFAAQYLWVRSKWLTVALVIYLLAVISPVYLGQMTGLFSRPRHAREYQALADYLPDSPAGKIVWVPQKPPLGYSDPTHLSINATTLVSKRPFAAGVVGAYDTLNFLREATYSGQLLQAAGIRYIAFAAADPRRDSQKPQDLDYRRLFPAQIQAQPWVSRRLDFGEVALLELANPRPLFYLADRTEFVIGSDAIYAEVPDLAGAALVFVDQYPALLTAIDRFPQARVAGPAGMSAVDVAVALAPASAFVFPASSLDFSPNQTGWWKRESADLISWRDFLQQKYNIDNLDFDFGGGWAIAEGERKLTVPLPPCPNRCLLAIRSLSSPRGGRLVVSVAGRQYPIPTRGAFGPTGSEMEWHEVGEVDSGQSQISLKASGDLNVVNALLVVESKQWAADKARAGEILSRQVSPTSPSAQLTWTRHNPTRYTVKVSGLINPTTLVFGQNYDPMWQLNGQSPVPVYSWLNGWSIVKDGEYPVEYVAQKYVWPGLGLSGLTLLLLTGAWILRASSKRPR